MIHPQAFLTLERLISRLPFHLDDVDRANALFDTWRISGSREDRKMIDLWSYCFVWRNVLLKFTRDPDLNPADFDMLVSHIFERILERRHMIHPGGRYSNWVSVVCRNTFINHLRLRKKDVRFEDEDSSVFVSEPRELTGDATLLLQVFRRAIDRLPGYLREIARLRMIEELTYEEISELTGKKIAVTRSYVNKALNRLREDRRLRVFLDREFREDYKNGGTRPGPDSSN